MTQLVEPMPAVSVPTPGSFAAHELHDRLPPPLMKPRGQSRGDSYEFGQYEPAGHVAHAVDPTVML